MISAVKSCLLKKRDIPVYLVAAALAALLIWLDLKLDDSGVSLILVSLFPMIMAIWRRDRPWRWCLFFAVPLIIWSLLAKYPLHMEREENLGYSIAALVPAFVGAYLGAMCRRAVEALWQEKE